MTDTLNWIYTKDRKPTFEECKDKVVIYHRPEMIEQYSEVIIFDELVEYLELFNEYKVDRYILIDIPEFIPEPVPCKVCGGNPDVLDPDHNILFPLWSVQCTGMVSENHHEIALQSPTRAEAIATWNKWNGG